MADFCKQCSIALFGEDCGDMKGLCEDGFYVTVICEGCGVTCVNHLGECIFEDCFEKGHKPTVIEGVANEH